MLRLAEQIKSKAQLRWNKVHKFQPKINLHIETDSYLIKTAETKQELLSTFKLRHEVFNQEFRGLRGDGLDFDKFDYFFDHIVIIHKDSQKIIGTYRVNCSKFAPVSYTGLEFNLSSITRKNQVTLELGRACIHKNFRKGSVISLLWRGIAEYMNLCGADILYGCTSLKLNEVRDAALVYRHLLNQGTISHEFICHPTKEFSMKHFDIWSSYFKMNMSPEQTLEAEKALPSLLKSYLKMGAKIASEPAYDEDFDCLDLLTVLKKEDLHQSIAQKYSLQS